MACRPLVEQPMQRRRRHGSAIIGEDHRRCRRIVAAAQRIAHQLGHDLTPGDRVAMRPRMIAQDHQQIAIGEGR